ncbi:succinate dehydrogenase, cytochrome b556 subunit [Woodsholea maritima]|uniref:succinate dehydrogenase, cytochrome b556 subunit n=1 Tax=Woodsholea maritima TaxID=240237 RepID=UPI00036B805A|nr:succinate dehydrogenase, cytochrome b556 subunit [Woodsholea maritima]
MASKADTRPLSPHVQVWRWHATMASSILHRATGVANYIGAVLTAIWLVLLAMGPEAYGIVETLQTGVLGVIFTLVLIGFTFSLTYHMLNGIRHLAWDAGKGFDPKGSNLRSILIIIASVVITALIWILA